MFKILLCLTICVVFVQSGPVSTEPPAQILKYEYEPSIGDSGYHFAYETSDQQSRAEDGFINNGTLRVNGTYKYVDTVGGSHTIHYLSDEHGFAESENLDLAANGQSRTSNVSPTIVASVTPVVYTNAPVDQPAAPTVIIP